MENHLEYPIGQGFASDDDALEFVNRIKGSIKVSVSIVNNNGEKMFHITGEQSELNKFSELVYNEGYIKGKTIPRK